MTRSHRSRCGITLADNFFMGAFGGSYLNHFCSSVRARRNIRTLTRARRRARFQRSSYFSWPSLVMTGGLLAPLAAVVLQRQDFTALPGISVIVGCLVINQAAHVVAIWLKNRDYLPQKRTDDVPYNGRNDRIDREHKRHQNAQSDPW
jgi:hypothetical protein